MKNENVFVEGWSNVSEMCNDFQISEQELEGCEIIVAAYEQGGYEGSAYVLFEKNGQLYQVSAGHCSCYGLEGSWSPEETSKEAIAHIAANGNYYVNAAGGAVQKIVEEWAKQ